MKDYKAILFDLDGTLLPMDIPSFTKGYFKMLAKRMLPFGYEPERLVRCVWGGTAAMTVNCGPKTNEEVFWDFFEGEYGPGARRDEPEFDRFYREDFDGARPLCGFDAEAAPTVRELKRMGFRVAVATNPFFPKVAVEKRIRWAGLEPEEFELITSYETMHACKPNLLFYEEVLRMMGLSGEECLMVGNDTDEDMPAEKLGCGVFLLTNGLLNASGQDISRWPHGSFGDLLRFVKES